MPRGDAPATPDEYIHGRVRRAEGAIPSAGGHVIERSSCSSHGSYSCRVSCKSSEWWLASISKEATASTPCSAISCLT